MIRMDPKSVGERSEGQVIAALLKRGKVVLTPFGDSQRYDLVIDEDGKFIRVQCKTGRLRHGTINFQTCSSQRHRGRGSQNYRGEIEMFGVYCPDLDKVFMVPVDGVGIRQASLRVESTKNRQAKNTRAASEFELA